MHKFVVHIDFHIIKLFSVLLFVSFHHAKGPFHIVPQLMAVMADFSENGVKKYLLHPSMHYKTVDVDIQHCIQHITNIPHSVLTGDANTHSTHTLMTIEDN